MLTTQQQRDVARAAEAVADALRDAVQATVDELSPDPARQVIGTIVRTGERSPTPDGANPAAMMTTYLLLHWLSLVREDLADHPDRVPVILAWIEEHLGKRYRLRARYPAAALDTAEGVEETADSARALGADFLPAILWLLAGAVACYGGGDAGWLHRLLRTDPN